MNKINTFALIATLTVASVLVTSPASAAEMMKKDSMVTSNKMMMQKSMSMAMSNHWTGKATWTPVAGAESYNLYIRDKGAKSWNSAVSGLNKMDWMHKVMHLLPGKKYEYTVAAVKGNGAEFYWSPVMMIKK